uniref:Uncharacterized protein n=1 Tax=Solanum lycopersicum TaxID=4081 RepID=A0A3Q7ITJ0_SOLLC
MSIFSPRLMNMTLLYCSSILKLSLQSSKCSIPNKITHKNYNIDLFLIDILLNYSVFSPTLFPLLFSVLFLL